MKRILLTFSLFSLFTLSVFAQNRPDALAKYRSGRNLEGSNRLQEATAVYNEAVSICNDEINRKIATRDTYVVMTWTLQRLKKYDDVISWAERGLKLYPDDYRLNEIMGEAFFYKDDYERSLDLMQSFVVGLPRNDRVSTAYFFMGEIFRIEGKFRRAEIAYSTAVYLEPNIALWWYRLGLTRESLKDYASAQEAFNRVLKLNPNYKEASEGLERIKQFDGAL
ncbi:MAG: tetratricopeptide repeat protein [Treponema sp.]|jgi:tetratricopeptide (TPR) repeat protein|nr:tetratricopeptide repeat protein [Treponema sp.]